MKESACICVICGRSSGGRAGTKLKTKNSTLALGGRIQHPASVESGPETGLIQDGAG
jgi:hypothetical protein